jgi:uncharacterized membrane protein YfcA
MTEVLVGLVSLGAAGLTFFSGFGLGTVLLPVFVLFMPTSAAIASVAIVHFLNNALKFWLVREHADRRTVLRFGVPGFIAAFGGAALLEVLDDLDPILDAALVGIDLSVTPVNLVVGVLLLIFGIQELVQRPGGRTVPDRYLPLGGAASGFVGGLSGLQGALRSAFLIRTGLKAAPFIATGAAIALLVDTSRIVVYSARGLLLAPDQPVSTLIAAMAGAFVGTLIGNRFIEKVTLRTVSLIVGVLLVVIAIALALGLV